MKQFKVLIALLLVVAMSMPLLGCHGGVGATPEQIQQDFNRTVKYDAEMLVEDIALFTQTRRPFRGSKWVID